MGAGLASRRFAAAQIVLSECVSAQVVAGDGAAHGEDGYGFAEVHGARRATGGGADLVL